MKNCKTLKELCFVYFDGKINGQLDQLIADFIEKKYKNKDDDFKLEKTLSAIRTSENYRYEWIRQKNAKKG